MAEEVQFTNGSEVILCDVLGTDKTIAEAAVVSTGADIAAWPDSRVAGLIERLMKDRHGAPFEHVVFRFLVRTPMFTARQMMRHRVASFNEASARYRVLPAVYYVPPVERPISQVGKAMDYDFVSDPVLSAAARVIIEQNSKASHRNYEQLIEAGVAREVARMVLPTNIMTEFIVTINLRSLFNVFSLRGELEGTFVSHPQYEIAKVATQMEKHTERRVPVAYHVFNDLGRVQP